MALAEGLVEVELLGRRQAASRDGSRRPRSMRRARSARGSQGTLVFSEKFSCLNCGTSMPELEPRIFSFNSPHGACPRCTGLGSQHGDRPRPGRRPDPDDQRGRDPALELGRATTTSSSRRRSPTSTRSTSTRRGRTCPRRTRTCSSTGTRASASTSPTGTGWGAGARTWRRSRASCRASSAATARPTRSSRASGSRSTCRSGPARSATARGCGRRASR